jgi:hypothetical protein
MRVVFSVRCSPRLVPQSAVAALSAVPRPPICSRVLSPLHAMCTPRDRPPPPPPPPAELAPHRVPCLRPSAERVGLQPATELGHLPRHGHVAHSSSPLPLRVPPPNLHTVAPSLPSARCVHAVHARCLPPPGPQPAPHPSRLSAGSAGLQPATELGHLRRHRHELNVSRALLPAPCPPICSCARSPARCVHAALARRLLPPSPQPALHTPCALVTTLGRTRKPSTSCSAGTPLVSQTWKECFKYALT